MRVHRRALTPLAIVAVVALTACGDSADDGGGTVTEPGPAATESAAATAGSAAPGSAADGQQFPDIVEATATGSGGTWTFEVTVSSPYDTPERYADGWRVLGPAGAVYGEHELTHDHAAEQPFTRTQDGVEIPEGVTEVTIEGRDLANGYGGQTAVVQLAAP